MFRWSQTDSSVQSNGSSLEKKKKKEPFIMKCCKKMPAKFIISYKSTIRQIWDFVPMALSIYNALLIPYSLSFALPY